MAYNNPFFYNRDSSIDTIYDYVDVSNYKPIYGSSVDFSSRLHTLETIDNALKVLPASENNLVIKYNLKFLLTQTETGNLLKTIEIAGGYKYLKFMDPSNLYKDFIGLVEDYSISKSSNNLNNVNLTVNCYFKSPIFNWRTSSILKDITVQNTEFFTGLNYSTIGKNKYDFFYYDMSMDSLLFKYFTSKNKIDNFWFRKSDSTNDAFTQTYTLDNIAKTHTMGEANLLIFLNNFSRDFFYEPKLPFSVENKFDIYQTNYKNSFIQNVKYKNNSNSLKSYKLKYENITTSQAKSMLLFLEKKCGYKKFIYNFPIFFNEKKVFICPKWNHTFNYDNSHNIDVEFIEDPNPNIKIVPSVANPIINIYSLN